MNRILKRPMFKLGGDTSRGITSGLGKPKMKMASADMEMKIKELTQAYDNYRKQGGTLSFQDFSKLYAEENFNSGGRVGYQTGGISVGGLPGFAISTGLNLLSQPPQGGLLSTAALAARDPFNRLQAEQAAGMKTLGEQKFIRDERIAGDKAAMERLKLKLASDERIAGEKTNDALYNVMLEQYIENDLPPQVAERAAAFSTTKADDLRSAVTGNRYGGVLQFDVRDPNNQKQIRKNLNGKVVYDPFEDNYKYIVVRDGEVFFDEFNSIEEITFPEITPTTQKKKIESPDPFSPNIEDIQGS
tara:strand:+ start:390 stop:1295 length:906 start_codon:yes stop_codon:yes gene_type:complete